MDAGLAALDVFVKDTNSGVVEQVSESADGTPGNGDSSDPSIGDDARFVAFESVATNLVPATIALPAALQVYLKDLETGAVTLVSAPAGVPTVRGGDGDSQNPSIASGPGGIFVAFQSVASNLGVTGGVSQILRKDVTTGSGGSIVVVSANACGSQGHAASESPSMSADGQFVAFESLATNLIPGFTLSGKHVYVKNLVSQKVVLASALAGTLISGDGDSGNPAIGSDGSYVVFSSAASNLVAEDIDAALDIYRSLNQ